MFVPASTKWKTLLGEVQTILKASARTNLAAMTTADMIKIGYNGDLGSPSCQIMPGPFDWGSQLLKWVDVKIIVLYHTGIGTIDQTQIYAGMDIISEVIDELTTETNRTTPTGWTNITGVIGEPIAVSKNTLGYELTMRYTWGEIT